MAAGIGSTYLSVGSHVLKHACDTSKRLVEVVALLQWVLDSLSRVSLRSYELRIRQLTFRTRSYSLPCAWFVFSVAVM